MSIYLLCFCAAIVDGYMDIYIFRFLLLLQALLLSGIIVQMVGLRGKEVRGRQE